jgi:ArsR family metal-binding transcriptional regulator
MDMTDQPDLTIKQPEPGPIVILDRDQNPILTVYPDGRVTLDQPEKADEAAQTFADHVTEILQGRLGGG